MSGSIIIKGKVKPTIIESFIFCKRSNQLKSDSIIESNDYKDIVVGKVEYIKNLPEDVEIWLYNSEGKRIFKGKKVETYNKILPISRYDVKVVGQSFKDKVLFYN